jgi:hypothetical protein
MRLLMGAFIVDTGANKWRLTTRQAVAPGASPITGIGMTRLLAAWVQHHGGTIAGSARPGLHPVWTAPTNVPTVGNALAHPPSGGRKSQNLVP